MQDRTIEIDSRAGSLHYVDESSGDFIRSFGGRVEGIVGGTRFSVDVGSFWLNQLGRVRLASRLLRIHRINVLPISRTRILIIYRNDVFVFELRERALRKVHTFPLTHYVHTQSIALHDGHVVIGEYGNIGKKKCVGALVSRDGGTTWNYTRLFDQGVVKNILAIKHDPVSLDYWVFTGDTESESGIHVFDGQFNFLRTVGKGLAYRAISAFFLADRIVWLTNNPFGISKVHALDRGTGEVSTGQSLPGPVWYSSQVGPDIYCCTAAEDVAGDPGENVYVLHSRDHLHWDLLCKFSKDGLDKRLFLYGLGTFPVISADSRHVYLNLDAVRQYDGCVVKIARQGIPSSSDDISQVPDNATS